jgi:hypothetical protein
MSFSLKFVISHPPSPPHYITIFHLNTSIIGLRALSSPLNQILLPTTHQIQLNSQRMIFNHIFWTLVWNLFFPFPPFKHFFRIYIFVDP